MAIRLLDLYNAFVSRESTKYNFAEPDDDLNPEIVNLLNRAISDIYLSHDWYFRGRTHLILTYPGVASYYLPKGIIKRKKGKYLVKCNSEYLDLILPSGETSKKGTPLYFSIKDCKINLYPIPKTKGLLMIEYYTSYIGENSEGEELSSLFNGLDRLFVPPHLERLMTEAIISKALVYIKSNYENDFYYQKQADKALSMLVKYGGKLHV